MFPSISFSTHAGYIIPHDELLKDVSSSVPYGFQADISWLKTNPEAWKRTHGYARYGISLQHFQFGNPSELGSSTQLSGYLEPYILRKAAFQWSFRFGMGSTYLSQVFDAETNPRNLFFSSPFSFVLLAGTTARYALHPNWKLALSANYNHISNGGIKMPNKGMNFPTLAIGFEYLPFEEIFPDPPRTKPRSFPWIFYLEGGGSLKNTPEDWGNLKGTFPIVNVAGIIEKKISDVHGFSLGLEFTEDQFLKQFFLFNEQQLAHQLLGGLVGHSFHLGRFSFSQQYGLYLFNQKLDRRMTYQRYGLYYQLFKRVSVGGTLKVHRHIADIFDIRLCYTWKSASK